MATQIINGKGFEYLCATEISNQFNITLREDVQTNANRKSHSAFTQSITDDRYNILTNCFRNTLPEIENKLGDRKPTAVYFNTDSAGKKGIRADIIIETDTTPCPISLKYNNIEVASYRQKPNDVFFKFLGSDYTLGNQKYLRNIWDQYPDDPIDFCEWTGAKEYTRKSCEVDFMEIMESHDDPEQKQKLLSRFNTYAFGDDDELMKITAVPKKNDYHMIVSNPDQYSFAEIVATSGVVQPDNVLSTTMTLELMTNRDERFKFTIRHKNASKSTHKGVGIKPTGLKTSVQCELI